MITIIVTMKTRSDFEEAFKRLGQYLEAVEAGELRLVIVGGAALNLLGLVSRTTTDADVIAVEEGGALVAPNDLPHSDLVALSPVSDEILSAAEWAKTQDAGPEFPRLIDAVVASVMEDVHH